MRKNVFWPVVLTALVLLLPTWNLHAAAEQECRVYLNGEYVVFEQAPVLKNGVTLVPVRTVFEALGARVDWQEGTVRVYAEEDLLTLRAGNSFIYKNNERIPLGTAPEMIGERMLVPIRAVSEALDCTVLWDGATRRIDILTPDREQYNAGLEKELFELVNRIRRAYGLEPFLWDSRLTQAARRHSKDMYVHALFDHNGSDGRSPFERMRDLGISYQYAAENIAANSSNAGDVADGWMQSEAHRANILNGNLGKMGVGYYGGYWTQDFTN